MSSHANGSLKKPQINAFNNATPTRQQKAPAAGKSTLGGLFSVATRYDPADTTASTTAAVPTPLKPPIPVPSRHSSKNTVQVPVPVLLPEIPKVQLEMLKTPGIAVPEGLPGPVPMPLPKVEIPKVPEVLPGPTTPTIEIPKIPFATDISAPHVQPQETPSLPVTPKLEQPPKLLSNILAGDEVPRLAISGITAPPATPATEGAPLHVPGLSPLPMLDTPKLPLLLPVGEQPIQLRPVSELPKQLPRMPTLPDVSLIPRVPDIPLLPPPPPPIQDAVQKFSELSETVAPANVAKMFEASPAAQLPVFPTIKYLPKSLKTALDQLPIPGGQFPFNAVVLLPVPKKDLEPLALPRETIPGATTLHMLIHGFVGGVLWNILPKEYQDALQPIRMAVSRVLGVVSILTRSWLLLWYTVLTALFRCPNSLADVTDDSPKICKSYLQLRDYATPYVQPYYDTYLKNYVDAAQPHVDTLNKNVITPAARFAKSQYDVHGAPRVAELNDYAQGTWSSTLKPRLEMRRKWARGQYDEILAPYVDRVSAVTEPYAREAYAELADVYDSTLVPLAQRALPYAQAAIGQAQRVTAEIVIPNVQLAQKVSWEFVSRKLWPSLVLLYGENVEPQLTKIMERVGRYKDSKKLQAAVDQVDGVDESTTASSSHKANEKASTSSVATPSATIEPETEQPKPSSEPEPVVDTREKIESDLSNWKEKFAVAAEKGAVDLRLRVHEITSRQIENQAKGVGAALVVQLEETAKSEIDALKRDIIKLVGELPEDADQEAEDALHEQIVKEVRSAGSAIKDKAQAVRNWETKYEADTTALVTAALDSTLRIIDSIRDLGLQQIGMRWANMEGVTYEDWATYHDLKSEFDDWRVGVQDAALKHDGLVAARAEGDHVREAAMKAAQDAVAELVRLRDASKWKIVARDASDDFSNKIIPARAKKAAQSVVDEVKDAAGVPSPSAKASGLDGAVEDLSEAVEAATASIAELFGEGVVSAKSVASEATSAVESVYEETLKPKTSQKGAAESVVSAAKVKAEQVSQAVVGTPPPPASQASSSVESVASDAYSSAESVISDASSAGESVLSAASSSGASASSDAASLASPYVDSASSSLSSLSSQASSNIESVSSELADEASTALPSKRSFGIPGAMAANVEARQIVLDEPFDDDSFADYLAAAGDKAAELTDAVKEALRGVTATPTQGTVESVTSAASEQIASALAKASEALYGTQTGAVESAGSVARDKYEQAVTAASYAIYGTPQPVLSSLSSQASAQYEEALSLAKEQYNKASMALAGTPKPAYEDALSAIESSYSESLSLASVKLDSILDHTADITKLWARPTQGAYESISSAASVRLQQGLAEASAQYARATSAVGLQPPPVHQQYLAEAQKQYYQGIGLAHDQYARFLEAASTAVYGTPTPVYQSLLEAAQAQYTGAVGAAQSVYDEVLKSASSVVGVTSKSPAQSVLDSASSQYEAAKSQAAEALAAASASASSVIYGTSTGNAEYLASVASKQLLGTETPWTEAAASQASANWDALIASASSAIYGTPTPWHESAYSQAGDWAAQATDSASAQYAALSDILNELIVGKEPDFTESVMARLSSAYYTGMPNYASSASSAASEFYASASSVVTSVFTPPPTLEAIISQATEQLNSAVDAASVQVYGTEPNVYEKASSAAADAASKASTAVYGTPPSFLESAQAGFADIGSDAQKALSEAIYGTPTGSFEAAGSSAASAYSSVSSAAAENAAAAGEKIAEGYSAASAKVSEAIYGPEKSALESAQARVLEAVSSARARLDELAAHASGTVKDGFEAAKSGVEDAASSISSAAASIKDEL